ncbi:MAG: DUF3109 family protein [Lentimicrobiaceae bacterium]|nr:DUF3109 family protein [Lentimicrobiaceae bacterium]
MLSVEQVIISDEVLGQYFACDFSVCKGRCCIEGDAGAPLEEDEISTIEDFLDDIKPYMSQEGVQMVEQNGVFDYDADGVLVTPLINDKECVFTCFEENGAKCAIEKAFLDGKIDFKKPISCHLYPIRIKKFDYYERLDYHQWEVCECARKNGKALKINVFDYLSEPLIRRYGKEWVKKVKKKIQKN